MNQIHPHLLCERRTVLLLDRVTALLFIFCVSVIAEKFGRLQSFRLEFLGTNVLLVTDTKAEIFNCFEEIES